MAQTPDYFGAMARNNAWANTRLLTACERLSQADFVAPRTGFFPSIKATLNHILAVDRYYLDGLTEGSRGGAVFLEPECDTAVALKAAQAEQDAALIAFCEGLAPEALERRVAYDRGDAGIWKERIDLVLLHLFQHQVHHRGQVHAMVSGTPVAPPQLDEFFIEFDRDPGAEPFGAGEQ